MADKNSPVDIAQASTADLLRELVHKSTELVKKEIELARVELKSNVDQEVKAARILAVAAVFGVVVLNLLLVAGVFGLATVMPGWLAALCVAGVVFVVTAIVAALGRSRLVREPLERTRKILQEDRQWAKELA
ncbi:MAG: phage holin family protein [Deltaproteobacteria bacterium]|nr:phage holin family protein [Deltaproteobacteria bacterium]